MSCRRQWKQKQMSSFICSSFFFPVPDSWQQAPSHFSLSPLSANSLLVLFLLWPILFALLLSLSFPHLIAPSLINFPLLYSFCLSLPSSSLSSFSSNLLSHLLSSKAPKTSRYVWASVYTLGGPSKEQWVRTYVHTWCVMPWKEHLVVVKSF